MGRIVLQPPARLQVNVEGVERQTRFGRGVRKSDCLPPTDRLDDLIRARSNGTLYRQVAGAQLYGIDTEFEYGDDVRAWMMTQIHDGRRSWVFYHPRVSDRFERKPVVMGMPVIYYCVEVHPSMRQLELIVGFRRKRGDTWCWYNLGVDLSTMFGGTWWVVGDREAWRSSNLILTPAGAHKHVIVNRSIERDAYNRTMWTPVVDHWDIGAMGRMLIKAYSLKQLGMMLGVGSKTDLAALDVVADAHVRKGREKAVLDPDYAVVDAIITQRSARAILDMLAEINHVVAQTVRGFRLPHPNGLCTPASFAKTLLKALNAPTYSDIRSSCPSRSLDAFTASFLGGYSGAPESRWYSSHRHGGAMIRGDLRYMDVVGSYVNAGARSHCGKILSGGGTHEQVPTDEVLSIIEECVRDPAKVFEYEPLTVFGTVTGHAYARGMRAGAKLPHLIIAEHPGIDRWMMLSDIVSGHIIAESRRRTGLPQDQDAAFAMRPKDAWRVLPEDPDAFNVFELAQNERERTGKKTSAGKFWKESGNCLYGCTGQRMTSEDSSRTLALRPLNARYYGGVYHNPPIASSICGIGRLCITVPRRKWTVYYGDTDSDFLDGVSVAELDELTRGLCTWDEKGRGTHLLIIGAKRYVLMTKEIGDDGKERFIAVRNTDGDLVCSAHGIASYQYYDPDTHERIKPDDVARTIYETIVNGELSDLPGWKALRRFNVRTHHMARLVRPYLKRSPMFGDWGYAYMDTTVSSRVPGVDPIPRYVMELDEAIDDTPYTVEHLTGYLDHDDEKFEPDGSTIILDGVDVRVDVAQLDLDGFDIWDEDST